MLSSIVIELLVIIQLAELAPLPGKYASEVTVNATSGDTTVLHCVTSGLANSFNWLFYKSPSDNPVDICVNGELINGFKERYMVPNYSTGNYSLTIRDVRLTESGGYVCRENNGFGPDHYVQLTVSANHHCSPCSVASTPPNKTSLTSESDATDSSNTHETLLFIILPLAGLFLGALLTICFRSIFCQRILNMPLNSHGDTNVKTRSTSTPDERSRFIADQTQQNFLINETKDLYGMMLKMEKFRESVEVFVNGVGFRHSDVDAIVGLDTHGFTFALLTAYKLNKPFVAVRKLRQHVKDVHTVSYTSRNESGEMYVQKNACRPGQRVVIVDEKLASGGTLKAVVKLMEKMEVKIVGCEVVVEDISLNGRASFVDYDFYSNIYSHNSISATANRGPDEGLGHEAI